MAKAKATKESKKFAINAKRTATLQGMGERIVEVSKAAHEGVRVELVKLFGLRPEEIEIIRAQFSVSIGKWADTLTARKTHSNVETVDGIKRQSMYNQKSQVLAVMRTAATYSGWTKEQRKAFDGKVSDATGYHALIALCRYTNRGNVQTSDVPVGKRETKAWQANTRERLAKAKNMIRFATVEALMVLRDFCDNMIAARRRSLVAKTGKGKAVIHKLRKAA